MALDAPPVRLAVSDDQPESDCRANPPSLARDCPSQAALSIGRPKKFVDIDDLRLEFDHEKGSRCGMPGQNVYDAPFAIDVEGHFGRDQPAGQPAEGHCHRLVERGVTSIQEAIQFPALPSDYEIQLASEGRDDPRDLVDV